MKTTIKVTQKEINESYPACVGTAKIKGRRYEVWNDFRTFTPLNKLWSLVPERFLSYNRKGMYICCWK